MKKVLTFLFFFCATLSCKAAEQFVEFQQSKGTFAVVSGGSPLNILFDPSDDEGVLMAVANLQNDFQMVCGTKPTVSNTPETTQIIVGTLQSSWIKKLMASGKLDKKALEGKTEKYLLTVIDKPIDGIQKALVIVGSDKRGAIYGVYELSRQMGVSPWYWWLDVPVTVHKDVYIKKGVYTDGEPAVRYRGIFINDEWPSFGNWAKEHFNGINSRCYERVFELVLRLKGNFMWPAMWASAFYDDDPQNGELANRMGMVMGTSHHEPMALAQQDWKRRGKGAWDYTTNADGLRSFWKTGVERAKNWEKVITVGMRGDGDMAQESNTKELLTQIVHDQRDIIEQVTHRPASETPQVWALYKEVQDFYDQGMQVPDDVTLLLCDDNWGNVRRLPSVDAPKRKGGYGMYYHFDYVGAPRNSKWINISPIPRVWEQLNLTYRHGVDKLWIVNVGDLKPMEYPITFFMDMAWNPERFHADNLMAHSVDFCRSIFGDKCADEAARLLRTYAKYNRRVTPELLKESTFTSLYGEWERVVADYNKLAHDAEVLRQKLPANCQDAYYELLGYPIEACSNLYDMYYAQYQNKRLARKKEPQANLWADRVEKCYLRDAELTAKYHALAGGKWNHMMDQIHIGYTSWNNPNKPVMPQVTRVDSTATPQPIVLPTTPSAPYAVRQHYEFVEKDDYVSIEAEHFTRKTDGRLAQWLVIPELGRTLSGITTSPCTATPDNLVLEYDINLTSTGRARIILRFAPTLNYNNTGHRYAISIDGGEEQTVNINGHYTGELGKWQAEHIIDSETFHTIQQAGRHTLRIRPLDAGLVLEKIMVNMGGMRKSFLGPEETLK